MDIRGRAAAQPSQGYSLVELMMVLACTSILLSAAIPGMAHIKEEWTLWGAARSVEASLQWGRMHAISSNTPMVFEISEDRKNFYWVDPESGDSFAASVRYLPDSTLMTSFPRRSLRFYPHGNAVPAGTYVIESQIGSYSVVVTPGGRIRTQRN